MAGGKLGQEQRAADSLFSALKTDGRDLSASQSVAPAGSAGGGSGEGLGRRAPTPEQLQPSQPPWQRGHLQPCWAAFTQISPLDQAHSHYSESD